jgi:DNA polymerase I-like protein with 3'-5' exonuclease and polymerase domains
LKLYDTTKLNLQSETEKLWVYNGLDCCITSEVFDVTERLLDSTTRATYEFSKSLQAPILEMNMHGVLIDENKRHDLIHEYQKEVDALEKNLHRLVYEGIGWEGPFNWRSNAQLIRLFYFILRVPRSANGTPRER